MNSISPLCSLCTHRVDPPHHPELVSHLFFDCDFTLVLWQQIQGWLGSLNIQLELNRTKLLFGVHNEDSLSVKNFIILTVKYYIWKTKFENKVLMLIDYQNYLKNKLEDQKNACLFEGNDSKFDKWLVIFDCIERICNENRAAPLPDQLTQIAASPPPPGTRTDP